MKVLVAVLGCLWASLGLAQEDTHIYKPGMPDILTIREPENPFHKAEVYYSNSEDQNSLPSGGRVLRLGDISVRVIIDVTTDAERIRVTPIDPSLVAVPADAWVDDGNDITILIMTPLY